jgi:hypothetical protein
LARFPRLTADEIQLVLALATLVAGVVIVLCLRESHSIAQLARLILAAWKDEWHGKDRVGKCNRGGTIISLTFWALFSVVWETHSLIRSHTESMIPIVVVFAGCIAFLCLSLYILAKLEMLKMLLARETRKQRLEQLLKPRGGRR